MQSLRSGCDTGQITQNDHPHHRLDRAEIHGAPRLVTDAIAISRRTYSS